MSDDETYPLDSREEAGVAAKAAAAGETARLAWAKDNAPIRPDQVHDRAYAVAMWLLTVSGKVGTRSVTLKDLYEKNFSEGKGSDSHYVGFYPGGVKRSFEQIEAFNRLQLERIDNSVEGLAIIIAQILCKRASLDEVHEISQADWGIQLPGGEYFVVAKSMVGRWKQRAAILKRRVSSDVFLVECMKVLDFEAGLEEAYGKGYPALDPDEKGQKSRLPGFDETEELLTNRILDDRDRRKRLEKKGARKESRRKARALAAAGVRKIIS